MRPGVRNAAWTSQRGQEPEKRANRMPVPLKRLEMLPAMSTRTKWNETPVGAGLAQRGEAVADLLPAGGVVMLQQLDVVPHVFGHAEEVVVRHEQRAGEVVGQRDAAELHRLRRVEVLLRALDDGVDGAGRLR